MNPALEFFPRDQKAEPFKAPGGMVTLGGPVENDRLQIASGLRYATALVGELLAVALAV